MVEWFKALTGDAKVVVSNPDTALISFALAALPQVLNGYPIGCDHHCWSNSF